MKHAWLLVALLSLACSGNVADEQPAAAELDECGDGDTSDCVLDGATGTRSCQIGEHGFVWGACNVAPREPDTCKQGDSYACGLQGMVATCTQIEGRWTYPPWSCATPLVLSFDDRPVEFTKAAGEFDLFGQSASIGTDWVSAKTPWLVLDRDQDGDIADGRELFGSMTVLPSGQRARGGFEALSALDADGDGWLTPRDPAFEQLQLWSDGDQDRRSSGAELRSLAAAGVEAIELSHRIVPRCELSGCELERARIVLRDETGSQRDGAVIDVHLRGF